MDENSLKIEALGEVVAELQEKIGNIESGSSVVVGGAAVEKPLPAAKPFKVGAKTFSFRYPKFLIEDRQILAHEAAEDKTLREKIAAEYPGLVVEKN